MKTIIKIIKSLLVIDKSVAFTVYISTTLGGLTALLFCKYILGFHY